MSSASPDIFASMNSRIDSPHGRVYGKPSQREGDDGVGDHQAECDRDNRDKACARTRRGATPGAPRAAPHPTRDTCRSAVAINRRAIRWCPRMIAVSRTTPSPSARSDCSAAQARRLGVRASTASASATLSVATAASAALSSVSPAASSTSSGRQHQHGSRAETDDAAGLERPDAPPARRHRWSTRSSRTRSAAAARSAGLRPMTRARSSTIGRLLNITVAVSSDGSMPTVTVTGCAGGLRHLALEASPARRPTPGSGSGRAQGRPGFAIATHGFGSRSALMAPEKGREQCTTGSSSLRARSPFFLRRA